MRSVHRRQQPAIATLLVVLLALVTAGLVVAALLRSAGAGETAMAAASSPLASGTPASSSSDSSSTDSSTADAEPTTDEQHASLGAARRALTGPATISVIGDSTGDAAGEWVDLWAQHLADDGRRVTLHQWATDQYASQPTTYGDGGDREVSIWNAGKPGGTADWAADRLGTVQPERPDLLILSLGHNNRHTDVDAQLDRLRGDMKNRWDDPTIPTVVILQNPRRHEREAPQAATLRSIRAWATDHDVPTIDVTSAFADPDRQMLDDAHPNPAGSEAWATTVADALG